MSKPTGTVKRFVPYLLSLLFVMAIVLQLTTPATADDEVDASLQKASTDLKITAPIVWRVTDHVAAIGYNFTNHVAVMYSPCLPLLNFGKDASKHASAHSTLQLIKDKDSCMDHYREKIIKLIQTNCHIVNDLVIYRKQVIITILLFLQYTWIIERPCSGGNKTLLVNAFKTNNNLNS